MTREEWLEKGIKKLGPHFKKRCNVKIPKKIKVSVSYARKKSSKKVLGQCLDRSLSTGGYIEIIITPYTDKAAEILATLAHELVHAIVGVKLGHRKEFSQCARRFGFLAPWTSTPSPRELKSLFKQIASGMPKFPHKAALPDENRKKQGTRMIKLQCLDCGFICRASFSAILARPKYPECGCGTRMVCPDLP